MKAKIKEKKIIAKGTLFATFDLLGKTVKFKAGQYFFITIPKLKYDDPRGNIRHFSIVNSPNQNKIISMATRLREESGFKKTLKDLPFGSEVEIGSTTGDFILPKSPDQELVFIAGGIGITPFMSMLKFITEEKLPFNVTLIYSNKDRSSTAFFKDLKELEKKNKNIKILFTMTQDPMFKGEKGRIDAKFIKRNIKNYQQKIFYVSGPKAFNQEIIKILKDLKIKNIKSEEFWGY